MRLLLIDNYDSFVYNLYQGLSIAGAEVCVIRNDRIELRAIPDYDGYVISPGPGDPRDPARTGMGPAIIKEQSLEKPVLGVCLGHQEIIYYFGGQIRPAVNLRHGKSSLIEHKDGSLFDGVPRRFYAGRYHSFVGTLDKRVSELRPTATCIDDGELMAVEHSKRPVYGVQFHPESVLTPVGQRILNNFTRVCKK